MKKKIFLRSMMGFSIGVMIGQLISIATSLIFANGSYAPCVPELVDWMGSEIHAVMLQVFLSGVIGMGFSGGSVIWEVERWGIAKQTGIYFLMNSTIMMLAAYTLYWMEHSLKGFLSYFGIFACIFVMVWMVQYAIARNIVKKMNETLYRQRE